MALSLAKRAVPSAPQLTATALDGLLGESLFPIFQGDGTDDPSVVALDASGAAVTVELVENLDHEALLRALSHAGAVGRLSRGELAARYSAGVDRFKRDLTNYLDSVPFRRPRPGSEGARLVVICAEATPEVWDAVEFLNRPDFPIKVLRADWLQAVDGREFVDVSPLVVPVRPKPALPLPDAVPPQAVATLPYATSPQFQTLAPTGFAPVLTRAARRRQQAATNPVEAPQPLPEPPPGQPTTRLSRKQLRERGELSNSGYPADVEFTGVFAQGTDAADHLSWDTTTLPVIARHNRHLNQAS